MRYINEYGPQVENGMSLMSTHKTGLLMSIKVELKAKVPASHMGV